MSINCICFNWRKNPPDLLFQQVWAAGPVTIF